MLPRNSLVRLLYGLIRPCCLQDCETQTQTNKTYPCSILSTATLVVEEMRSFHGNSSLGDARSFLWKTFTRNSTITERRKLLPAPNTPAIITVKFLNFRCQHFFCNLPKIQIKRPNLRIFRQKDASGMANNEDPDQTAPRGAV